MTDGADAVTGTGAETGLALGVESAGAEDGGITDKKEADISGVETSCGLIPPPLRKFAGWVVSLPMRGAGDAAACAGVVVGLTVVLGSAEDDEDGGIKDKKGADISEPEANGALFPGPVIRLEG